MTHIFFLYVSTSKKILKKFCMKKIIRLTGTMYFDMFPNYYYDVHTTTCVTVVVVKLKKYEINHI